MSSLSFAERRKQRMSKIRDSLATNPALHATNDRLSQKIEKKARRTSIQFGELSVPPTFEDILSEEEDNFQSAFHQKYTLGEKTGEGAHGVVKKCYDKKTGAVYAVKTMTLEREHLLFLKKNFMEIKALKHAHILTYKALFFQIKYGRCYLVMDYLPFPDLLQAEVKSEEELRDIVYQLLETLKYIHQNKICHRDIKPENILYCREQKRIIIIDFGISKKVEDRGRKKEMLTLTGTPYYRAPEMFEGGGYDEMVDLWALGITIFKLMTGFTPFESEYHSDTISNILKNEVVFPEELKFECSQYPKNLVRRLVKKRKEERLNAEAAILDPWFLGMKGHGEEDIIRSMCMNKPEVEFNPKLSVKYKAPNFTRGKKETAGWALEEESEETIFGMEQALRI